MRNAMIQFNNYTGKWKEDDKKPTLNKLNLKIMPQSLNAIIGTIGCGKSSLFMALLREIPFYTGSITSNCSMGYVE